MRVYDVYWTVVVKSPAEKVRLGDDVDPGVIPAYERRFEFHGETAEQDAQDCRRRAKAAGLEARMAKARAVESSWTPELAE